MIAVSSKCFLRYKEKGSSNMYDAKDAKIISMIQNSYGYGYIKTIEDIKIEP